MVAGIMAASLCKLACALRGDCCPRFKEFHQVHESICAIQLSLVLFGQFCQDGCDVPIAP